MSQIIARKKEVEILKRILESKKAEFLALYGRRRVGKTHLISQYYKDKGLYFELTGIQDLSKKDQIKSFFITYKEQFKDEELQAVPKNWTDALTHLRKQIQKIDKDQKVILFLDELPWLASKKSGFLPALDHLWNRYLSRMENVILVVCGSASSWMIRHIIDNKGGLYGRLTAEMHLQPYTLSETEIYLKSQDIHLDRKQITELYMALGGIPKYLEYVMKGKSAAQNVQEILFSPHGPLSKEFYKLYSSLFENPQHHLSIVEALSKKHGGMTREELLQKTLFTQGGFLSKVLRELEESDFILFLPDFGKKKKGGRYRLVDEFSLFYFTWLQKAQELRTPTLSEDYWLYMQQNPSYTSWAGYAFENVCLKYVNKIVSALHLSAVAISATTWSYLPNKRKTGDGVQVDLVIDRRDLCINLCELRYYNTEVELTQAQAKEINRKRERFREVTKTRKALFNTLITPYAASKNPAYLSAIDNQLSLDVLFD